MKKQKSNFWLVQNALLAYLVALLDSVQARLTYIGLAFDLHVRTSNLKQKYDVMNAFFRVKHSAKPIKCFYEIDKLHVAKKEGTGHAFYNFNLATFRH